MRRIIIDGDSPAEVNAENSQITGHAKDSRLDRSVSKKIEGMKSEARQVRYEIGRVGEDNRSVRAELRTHSAINEKLKLDTDSVRKELGAIKTKVDKGLDEIRADNRAIRKDLNEMRASAQVKDAVTALGVGVLAKAIVKKAIPWGKG